MTLIALYILDRHFMSVIQINRPCLLAVFKVANSLRRSLESPSEKLSDVEECQCAEEKVQTSQPAKLGHPNRFWSDSQPQTYAFVIIIITLKDTINHILIKSKKCETFSQINWFKYVSN